LHHRSSSWAAYSLSSFSPAAWCSLRSFDSDQTPNTGSTTAGVSSQQYSRHCINDRQDNYPVYPAGLLERIGMAVFDSL
jgi:hypothetical protein